jgi:hypothetical protein
MADYDWFDRTPPKECDEQIYGKDNSFVVRTASWTSLNSPAKHRAETVWCEWCWSSIFPAVHAMRQHRRVCDTDPRVAAKRGLCSDDIKEMIRNG